MAAHSAKVIYKNNLAKYMYSVQYFLPSIFSSTVAKFKNVADHRIKHLNF